MAGASWRALGTTVELRVCDAAALAPARAAVEGELAAIDLACSRFRPDSELSIVNARAGRRTSIGPLLAEALTVALRAAELTDGDVDPALGRALELAGYDRDWELLSAPAPVPYPGGELRQRRATPPAIARVRAIVRRGWREIELDRTGATVRVPRGISLDLGASAKAWAADRAAAAAARAGGCGALVGVGGDLATCGGAPAGGWRVFVTDDHRSGLTAPGQFVTIAGGGIATSSTAVRRWRRGAETMHHIIDPTSGTPVRGTWRTVTVAAADCADANTAATAALVRAGEAESWLGDLGLPARLVEWSGSVRNVAGWPA